MTTAVIPVLRAEGILKSFGGIQALRGVSLEVFPGECLALVGENGAGKSTLMKILSGVWPHGSYQGVFEMGGAAAQFASPLDGRRAGISIIHQELCLFPKLTVAENLFLTEAPPYQGEPSTVLWAPVKWSALKERAENLFRELGFTLSATASVESLSVAERQLVEIARAIHHRSRVLILDEPTSALSKKEVTALYRVLGELKSRQLSLVYISHKLDEVLALSDRIVVLRDGQSVAELVTRATTEAEIIKHMVGRPLSLAARVSAEKGETRLRAQGVSHVLPDGKRVLDEVSFSVRAGEILGVAGLMGAGRSELLRSLLGVLPGERSGSVEVCGQQTDWQGIGAATEAGIAFLPEDRKKDGLFLDHAISFNMTIGILSRLLGKWHCLDLHKEQTRVQELIKALWVRCTSASLPVKSLSGGNQQKVLLAKVMASGPKILFLDEPTRGIDIGAKEEIYEIIRRLAREGLAVVLVSSELPEILALSDRVLVLRSGKCAGILANHDLTQESVMKLAAGETSVH